MEKNDNILNHLKALIQLSIADNHFGQPEKTFVYKIGQANGVSKGQVDRIVDEVFKSKENIAVDYKALMPEERFEYLHDIIQLMKIDGQVYLSEIKYCEEIAQRLGYQKKAVKIMATAVYADPSILGDKKAMMKRVDKYLTKK